MGNPENPGQEPIPEDEPDGQKDTKYQGAEEDTKSQGVPDDTEGVQEDTKYQG